MRHAVERIEKVRNWKTSARRQEAHVDDGRSPKPEAIPLPTVSMNPIPVAPTGRRPCDRDRRHRPQPDIDAGRDTRNPSGYVDKGVPRMAGRTAAGTRLTPRFRQVDLPREQVLDGLAPGHQARLAALHEHGRRAREEVVGDGHRLVVGARHGDREEVARAGVGERQVLAQHVARLAVAARELVQARRGRLDPRGHDRRVAGPVERHPQVVAHPAVDGDPGRAGTGALDVHHAVEGHAGRRDDGAARLQQQPGRPRERAARQADHLLDVASRVGIGIAGGIAHAEPAAEVEYLDLQSSLGGEPRTPRRAGGQRPRVEHLRAEVDVQAAEAQAGAGGRAPGRPRRGARARTSSPRGRSGSCGAYRRGCPG